MRWWRWLNDFNSFLWCTAGRLTYDAQFHAFFITKEVYTGWGVGAKCVLFVVHVSAQKVSGITTQSDFVSVNSLVKNQCRRHKHSFREPFVVGAFGIIRVSITTAKNARKNDHANNASDDYLVINNKSRSNNKKITFMCVVFIFG